MGWCQRTTLIIFWQWDGAGWDLSPFWAKGWTSTTGKAQFDTRGVEHFKIGVGRWRKKRLGTIFKNRFFFSGRSLNVVLTEQNVTAFLETRKTNWRQTELFPIFTLIWFLNFAERWKPAGVRQKKPRNLQDKTYLQKSSVYLFMDKTLLSVFSLLFKI